MPTEDKTPLQEPVATPVNEADLPAGAAKEASVTLTKEDNALSSIRAGMQELRPAVPEKSTAQKMSEGEQAPAEKKEFPPIGTSDVKEHKQVESKMDEPAEPGSALEGFQSSLKKARRAKTVAAQKASEKPEDKKDEAKPDDKKTDETTAETKPEDKKVETPTGDDAPVTDEEIERTIADPAISRRHQKRMIHLANKTKELEKKLAEVTAKPQTTANDEKIKELSEKQAAAEKELMQYQRRYSLENEPELKKYDEVAQKADEAIYGRLKGKISDRTIDLIKAAGGFGGFSKSGQTFNIEVEVEGEKTIQTVTAAQLARRWLNDMDVEDSEFIKSKLGEKLSAVEQKKSRAEQLTAESEQWFKSKQEEQQKLVEQQVAHAKEYQTTYETRLSEWTAKQEALKDKVVPPTATPEEKKEIEDYNKHNAGIRAMIKMAIAPSSVDDHVAIVQEAANSLILSRDNARLKRENEALQQKLKGLKDGLSTTSKPGGASISRVPAGPKQTTVAEQLNTPVSESLREGLERLRQQQGS